MKFGADLRYALNLRVPSDAHRSGQLDFQPNNTGVLSADEGYNIFLRIGWPTDLARKVADHYGTTTTAAAADPHIGKAQVQLWTTTHRSENRFHAFC